MRLQIGLSFLITTVMLAGFQFMCVICWNLEYKHADLYKQFADGFVTVAKTNNPFSYIGFDHNHEQLNKELKMHDGILNLSDEYVFAEWSVKLHG